MFEKNLLFYIRLRPERDFTCFIHHLRTTGLVLTHPLPQSLGLPVPDFLVVDLLRSFPFSLAFARHAGGCGRPHGYRDGLSTTFGMLLRHRSLDFSFRVLPFDRTVFDLVPVGSGEVGMLVRKM